VIRIRLHSLLVLDSNFNGWHILPLESVLGLRLLLDFWRVHSKEEDLANELANGLVDLPAVVSLRALHEPVVVDELVDFPLVEEHSDLVSLALSRLVFHVFLKHSYNLFLIITLNLFPQVEVVESLELMDCPLLPR